jgi:catechol 2,3-dioxygenase-like lactoylglutathione lyase family enzyme
MYQAFQLSPMIPSFDVRATVSFFTDVLSFSVVRDEGSYVILMKDNSMVHIQRAGDIGEMSCYLAVDDIDVLWASMEDKIKKLKVRAPFDRDYGMREVHIIVPETKTLLFIGQAIKQQV